jgi:hypothetical protein
VVRINDVGVYGNNFGLRGDATAVIIDRLILANGRDKIGDIPLIKVKARPSLHGRDFAKLLPRKWSPAARSDRLRDGCEGY